VRLLALRLLLRRVVGLLTLRLLLRSVVRLACVKIRKGFRLLILPKLVRIRIKEKWFILSKEFKKRSRNNYMEPIVIKNLIKEECCILSKRNKRNIWDLCEQRQENQAFLYFGSYAVKETFKETLMWRNR
jgi:hypothetical protein